jgi:hypothetical protein
VEPRDPTTFFLSDEGLAANIIFALQVPRRACQGLVAATARLHHAVGHAFGTPELPQLPAGVAERTGSPEPPSNRHMIVHKGM